MAIHLVVHMQAMAGKREEVLSAYRSRGPQARGFPGCLGFETFQSIEQPDRFVLLERWGDQESLSAWGQSMREQMKATESIRRITGTERHSV